MLYGTAVRDERHSHRLAKAAELARDATAALESSLRTRNVTEPRNDRSFLMAADIFAKIGDIKGESIDAKHKDEIEVLSFSWGVTNSVANAAAT